jgi:hypothetical protein
MQIGCEFKGWCICVRTLHPFTVQIENYVWCLVKIFASTEQRMIYTKRNK